ncbi:MAG: RNA polymerase sigma factor [Phycisphaerae bacterium]
MTMTEDRAALAGFVRERTEEAFRVVVEGHVDWVYSAARRMVGGDGAMAEDVAQAAFWLLGQRPERVRGSVHGWLHGVLRYCAKNAMRGEGRRAKHERRAAAMRGEEALEEEGVWEGIEPVVEEMVGKLREREREVVLLRFYRGKSYGEIGEALGISEEAARKRVSGAVERLRGMMRVRGVMSPEGAALGAVMAGRMTGMAPEVLRAKVLSGGAGVSAQVTGVAEGARQMMWMMKVKSGLAAAVAAAVVLWGSGWMLWGRAAADAGAGVVAGSPAAVTVGAASMAAATDRGLDLSSPEKTLAAFCEAVKSGDRGATYRCLLADPGRKPTVLDGMLDLNLALERLVAEGKQKFGPGATTGSFGFLGIGDVAGLIMGAAGPESFKRTGEGASAELTFSLEPEAVMMMPRGAQQVVALWSGAPLRFKKVGAEWRLDLDRTMKVTLRNVEDGKAAAGLEEIGQMMERVAGGIRDGSVGTLAEARATVREGVSRISGAHGVRWQGVTIVPAE